MKTIQLTKGFEAMVDDEDFEFLSKSTWHMGDNNGYPRRSDKIYMHRLLLTVPKGQYCDHIDGNKLNNQKSNLRICTNQQNAFNRGASKLSQSGYKGVYRHECGKWQAKITIGGRAKHLGFFTKKEDAAMAYDSWAKKVHNAFAKPNLYGG